MGTSDSGTPSHQSVFADSNPGALSWVVGMSVLVLHNLLLILCNQCSCCAIWCLCVIWCSYCVIWCSCCVIWCSCCAICCSDSKVYLLNHGLGDRLVAMATDTALTTAAGNSEDPSVAGGRRCNSVSCGS